MVGLVGTLVLELGGVQVDQVVHPSPAIATVPCDRMSAGADTVWVRCESQRAASRPDAVVGSSIGDVAWPVPLLGNSFPSAGPLRPGFCLGDHFGINIDIFRNSADSAPRRSFCHLRRGCTRRCYGDAAVARICAGGYQCRATAGGRAAASGLGGDESGLAGLSVCGSPSVGDDRASDDHAGQCQEPQGSVGIPREAIHETPAARWLQRQSHCGGRNGLRRFPDR